MSQASRIIRSVLTVALPLLVWQGAIGANTLLSCNAIGKHALSCQWAGVNWEPLLSNASWWGMLLLIPGAIASVILVTRPVPDHALDDS